MPRPAAQHSVRGRHLAGADESHGAYAASGVHCVSVRMARIGARGRVRWRRLSVQRAMLDNTLMGWTFGFRYGLERAQEAHAWHAQDYRRRSFTYVTAQLLDL